MSKYETASIHQVYEWFYRGIFHLEEGKVFKGTKELTQRINKRKRCEHGDPRVDIRHRNFRKSINVSHIVWMLETKQLIPKGWEVHHIDDNPLNNDFSNLIVVHPLDHNKLHYPTEEIPF